MNVRKHKSVICLEGREVKSPLKPILATPNIYLQMGLKYIFI
jgi:chaperone required for assembly of F1-ATPase